MTAFVICVGSSLLSKTVDVTLCSQGGGSLHGLTQLMVYFPIVF